MWDILSKVFVTFLIIYFVFDVVEKVVKYINDEKKLNKVVIIKVRNRADDIEGIIRSLVWRFLKQSFGGYVPYIIVVDMGCEDETMEIVRRLRTEYGFLIPLTYDDYKNIRRK